MTKATTHITALECAYNGFLSRLHSEYPTPTSPAATVSELEDRAMHLKAVLDAVTVYARAVMADTAYVTHVTQDFKECDELIDASATLVSRVMNASYRLEVA